MSTHRVYYGYTYPNNNDNDNDDNNMVNSYIKKRLVNSPADKRCVLESILKEYHHETMNFGQISKYPICNIRMYK
jgi:hypothetical protein